MRDAHPGPIEPAIVANEHAGRSRQESTLIEMSLVPPGPFQIWLSAWSSCCPCFGVSEFQLR
jgi:hypothetical protein